MTIVDPGLNRLESASFPFATRLKSRVTDLIGLYREDYNAEPSMTALRDMIDFFEVAPVREYSFLTLTPDGNWYLEWRMDERSKLAIEFATGGMARFFSSRPNARHPEKSDTYTGTTTADSLADYLQVSSPWKALAA